MSYYESNSIKDTHILQDCNVKGKQRPWVKKKLNSGLISESMERIGFETRACKMSQCGSNLFFKVCPNDGFKKLFKADFCRDRMCAMCNWRRSRKLANDVDKVIHKAILESKMRFIFVTLTTKRCKSEELNDRIDLLYSGFNLLMRRKELKDVTIGYVRTLEVTYDNNLYITKSLYKRKKEYFKGFGLKVGDLNPEYDTYNPHFHMLLAVKPSYFTHGYIKDSKWRELWQDVLRLDYKPTVNVKAIKENKETMAKEAIEVAKYSVKDADYIIDDKKKMDEVVETLAVALHGRRLIAFGKLFLQIKKELKLKDADSKNADLTDVGDGNGCVCALCGNTNLIDELYSWCVGLKNFYKKDIRE